MPRDLASSFLVILRFFRRGMRLEHSRLYFSAESSTVRRPMISKSAFRRADTLPANAPASVLDTNTATRNRGLQSILSPRQHLPPNNPNRFRSMLSRRTLQRIRPFECIGSNNLHLPSVIRLRSDNQNPPIPGPIRKHVLNHCSDFTLQCSIARVLQLH
jgi:hypothetical protein